MIVDSVLAKIFGTKNEREIKALRPTVAAINDLEPAIRQLSDIDLAAKTIEFKERLAQGATLDDRSDRSLRRSARGRPPRRQHAPFRCAVDRRHGAAQRQNRRNEDRRRQDAGRHAAHLFECARRQGRTRGHRQRLPGQARFRMDGPHLQSSGHARGRDCPRPGRPGAQGRLRRRYHLRHQQRIRLRLPARQHEVPTARIAFSALTISPLWTKSIRF